MAPSPYICIISIGPVDMNKYARFDEIQSMTLKDIKKTKCYGRKDGRTDNVKTVYPPTNTVCGGNMGNKQKNMNDALETVYWYKSTKNNITKHLKKA